MASGSCSRVSVLSVYIIFIGSVRGLVRSLGWVRVSVGLSLAAPLIRCKWPRDVTLSCAFWWM